MELKFDESTHLENNYWDVSAQTKPQKKKVTFGYDDILSSINLVVNKNGVLQYMTPNDTTESSVQEKNPTVTKKAKIDPQIKNSAIFNKYFKNFKDTNEVEEVKIPKTKEEYRKMLIEDHIKRIQAQKRIAQIKPRKMFFGANVSQMPIYASQNSLNHLFKFK